jgi:hypothetical protein
MGAYPKSFKEHTNAPQEAPVMKTQTQPMADSRDMFVVHDMFRRQFKAIPSLVSEIPGGDAAQVAIVADHVTWMVTFLHAHHEGEDQFVWPKLLERIPEKIDPLIMTMEAQHAGLATALDDLKAKAAEWSKTCAVQERDALAGAATALLVRIAEMEWQKVGGSGLKKMSFSQLKVAFGMILDDAGPEQVKIMRDTIPLAPWTLFSLTGPRAYAKYAQRLHSADVPALPVAA